MGGIMEHIVRLHNCLPGSVTGTELTVYALLAGLGGKTGISLTSVRRIAAALHFSPTTVFRARRGLKTKGLLRSVPGRSPEDPFEYRVSSPPKKDYFCVPGAAILYCAGNAFLVLAYLHCRANYLGLSYQIGRAHV